MDIVHIITGLGTGGAERMLVNVLEASDRARFSHQVISLIDHGAQGVAIEALGVPVEALGVPVEALGMSPSRPSLRALWRLRRRVAALNPDLIHGWMYHGALAGLLAARRRPVVVGVRHSLHDERREKWSTRLTIRVLRTLSGKAARLLYCAQVSRAQHEQFGFPSDNALVIPNGFDCERFRPDASARAAARASLGIAGDAVVVGHLARYHPMKDHANLLQAAARLIRQHPKTCFVLAGWSVSEANPTLARLVEELDLTGSVRLLGERQDIPRLLNACDLLSSSSAWGEAFPNVLGEAMACGLPCVATDVGDSAYIIGDTGRVVPPRDAQALAAAIGELVRLSRAARARLGDAARQRVVEHFSLDSVARAYERLYEDVAREERGKKR